MVTLFVINGPTSFMNTPVKAEGISPQDFLAAATLWDKIANYSWMPLNLHRIDGNVAFGGFVAGMIAAYMYMGAKKQEERAYYDWMGFVGNLIGVGAMLFQPFMGFLLAYEMCDYDFSFCPYMMADQLSMFFEMQGAMIGLMFLASNYYVWLSMKRIEGVEKVRMTILAPIVMVAFPFAMINGDDLLLDSRSDVVGIPSAVGSGAVHFRPVHPDTVSARTVIKIGFLMVIVGDAIWLTPHGFVATGAKMVAELELP